MGTSAASEVIAVKAATVPFKITEIEILFQSMYQLSVKWTPAHNGGDQIVDYAVYWDKAEGVFEQIGDTTYNQTNLIQPLTADGSDAGKSYFFKISAINSIGEGELSDPFLILAASVPDAPIQLLRNDILSTREVVSFTWEQGTGNGGSPVIDYRVSYDQGIGSFVVIGDSYTSQSFTSTALQGITPGHTYRFYVEARNAVGYSQKSQQISIRAAIKPDAPFNLQNVNSAS